MVRRDGQILFAGKSLHRRSTEEIASLGVGHVPEGRGTFVGLTVEENLRLGGYTKQRQLPESVERMYGYSISRTTAASTGRRIVRRHKMPLPRVLMMAPPACP